MKVISLYAGDVAADQPDEPQELTLAQLARRKQWAIIVCLGAQNETSRRMGERLCHSWFPNCNDCKLRRGEN